MIEIKLLDRTANDVMDIVRILREQELIQGKDFDFAYVPAKYDYISGHLEIPKHTVFKFHAEQHATFFALRWAS